MLFASHLAVVVVAATAATAAASSVVAPILLATPSPNVVSSETASTTTGNSASTPSIPAPPTLPIGMRRMFDYDYPFPSAPTALPSPSPPVGLPELTNSERLALGLPIRAPRLPRVPPGSPLDGLDKDALLHGAMARLPRPSSVPKKRHGPSMLPRAAVPSPTPPRPVPRPDGPAAPAIGVVDGLVRYCAVSGACQTPKVRSGVRDW